MTKEACFLFVKEDIAAFIIQNLEKVGSAGVKVSRSALDHVPKAERECKEIRGTLSAPRLDTVVAHLTFLARAKAAALIEQGYVKLDHFEVTQINAQVKQGAILSIKGYGRYQIDQIGPTTKKGRLIFTARRFL